MDAPNDEMRYRAAEVSVNWRPGDYPDAQVEQELDEVLGQLEDEMSQSIDIGARVETLTEEEAEDQLAAVDAWAGLISSVIGRAYAPASPWPRRSAGWDKRIVKRLRRMATKLRAALAPVSSALGAVHFSISVGFPWGIAIGLSF
ncbi:MAG: hypothetical protein L0H41_08975 [Microlunatus sp.]|nr:hypothetical protein [Microlunatus sp.]